MPVLSDPRHEQFVFFVATGRKPADAYTEAGFSPNGAASGGARLLRNERVKARLAEVEEEIRRRAAISAGLSRKTILDRLEKIATIAADPKDRVAYNPSAANRALELMGKELGMFVDRQEVKHLDSMTPEQISEKLKEEEEKLAAMKAATAQPVSGGENGSSGVQ